MRVFTLAAGLATGYILGSRAGREKYEQIVAQYQKVSSHPTVVRAQAKAKETLTSRADEMVTRLDPTAPDNPPQLPASSSRPRPTRRKATSPSVTPGPMDRPPA